MEMVGLNPKNGRTIVEKDSIWDERGREEEKKRILWKDEVRRAVKHWEMAYMEEHMKKDTIN